MKKKTIKNFGITLLMTSILFLSNGIKAQASTTSDAKIHFLTLPSNTNCILLECDGHFGMVDSGEDTDYPDGSDSKYPDRSGIVKDSGYEDEVIEYLYSVGVTSENFDFYIGTHAHSDHIGSADEIIREFLPDAVYIHEYKDEYIYEETRLWDNLYVYDQMIEATLETGATLIQNLDADSSKLTLGSGMHLQIVNYSDDYKSTPQYDINNFSWGVLVEANGKTAFLSGDISNLDGDETALIDAVGQVDVFNLCHHGYYGSNTETFTKALDAELFILCGHFTNISNAAYEDGTPSGWSTLLDCLEGGTTLYTTTWYDEIVDAIIVELKPELSTNIPTGYSFIGHILRAVPDICVYFEDGHPTSYTGWFQTEQYLYYFNNSMYSSSNEWKKLGSGDWLYLNSDGFAETGFETINGKTYYFDSDYCMVTGWNTINDETYYFHGSGAMAIGWHKINSIWYYFYEDGTLAKDAWINHDYVDENGAWHGTWKCYNNTAWWYRHADGSYTTSDWELIDGSYYYFDEGGWRAHGWKKIDGFWYYFYSDGRMAKNTWIDIYYVDGNGVWTHTYGKWFYKQGLWWYRHYDGSYTTSDWEYINGKYYYFDADGWMCTGWIELDEDIYYLSTNGDRCESRWVLIDGLWYYFYEDGRLATNTTINGYYVDENGVWIP